MTLSESTDVPLALSVEDAAALIGVKPYRMYELCKGGAIESRKIGGRVLVDRASVIAFYRALPRE